MSAAQINKGISTKFVLREQKRNVVICPCAAKYLEMNEVILFFSCFSSSSVHLSVVSNAKTQK